MTNSLGKMRAERDDESRGLETANGLHAVHDVSSIGVAIMQLSRKMGFERQDQLTLRKVASRVTAAILNGGKGGSVAVSSGIKEGRQCFVLVARARADRLWEAIVNNFQIVGRPAFRKMDSWQLTNGPRGVSRLVAWKFLQTQGLNLIEEPGHADETEVLTDAERRSHADN